MSERIKREVVIPENRDFKGVWISDRLYLTREFTPNEKFVLIEIHSLTKKNSRQCYATNKHFADFVGLKENTIQKMLLKFEKSGYIKRIFEYKENSKEIERRIIKLTKKFYDSFVNENDEPFSETESYDYQCDGFNSMEVYGKESMPSHGKKSTGEVEKKSETSNTTIKYNNSLSNTDVKYNNTINAFTSREEVKGDIYAFERKSTPQKQEKSAPKVPYIDAQNFTWGELHEHIHTRVTKLFRKHGVDDSKKLEDLCKIIEYFYRKYDSGWKRYTILSDKALESIVVKYLYPSYLLEENGVYSFEAYRKMIDKYFNTDFGKNDKNGYGTKVPVELSLPHFMDDAIRESMAMNSLDMTDCIKSVHADYYE